jgi:hypothetical protein
MFRPEIRFGVTAISALRVDEPLRRRPGRLSEYNSAHPDIQPSNIHNTLLGPTTDFTRLLFVPFAVSRGHGSGGCRLSRTLGLLLRRPRMQEQQARRLGAQKR